jgi:hypothetical protein
MHHQMVLDKSARYTWISEKGAVKNMKRQHKETLCFEQRVSL